VKIRTPTGDEREAIVALVRAAFGAGGRSADYEVDIVRETWRRGASPAGLELVAVADDAVVGHVLGAYGRLDRREVLGIAPLAVAPAHQGQGVGTALMTQLISVADAAGLPLVVLLGNPAYYGRFGFEPSGPLGITYRPVGADNPHFQVRRLSAYDESWRGDFTYCWELTPGA
jgi:putative acetyltransferase